MTILEEIKMLRAMTDDWRADLDALESTEEISAEIDAMQDKRDALECWIEALESERKIREIQAAVASS